MKKFMMIFSAAVLMSMPVYASTDSFVTDTKIQTQPNSLQVECAFSPDQNAEALVLKVIDTSVSQIRVAAYSFSSNTIVQALFNAKKRGVDIKVLVDNQRNKKKNTIAALNTLAKAGIPIRTVAVYAMHHNKYIVSDERTVQNGSFNYTKDAAESNSENVIVLWNDPQLAKSFLDHWENRWKKGVDYKIR